MYGRSAIVVNTEPSLLRCNSNLLKFTASAVVHSMDGVHWAVLAVKDNKWIGRGMACSGMIRLFAKPGLDIKTCLPVPSRLALLIFMAKLSSQKTLLFVSSRAIENGPLPGSAALATTVCLPEPSTLMRSMLLAL